MEPSGINLGKLAGPSKIFARRLLAIGANRVELLMVEVQEERGRLLQALLLGCGLAASAFLAVLALNAALVVLFWETSRVAALAVSGSLYAALAVALYRKLGALLRDWTVLGSTLDQLRKDRGCLDEKLR